MTESELWKKIKRQLEKIPKEDIHYERIENRYGTGIPDVLLCYQGNYSLLELKVHPNKLQKNQRVWHNWHTRAGGNVWIVTYKDATNTLFLAKTENEESNKEIEFSIQKLLEEINNGNRNNSQKSSGATESKRRPRTPQIRKQRAG
jgi:hypothetical protein